VPAKLGRPIRAPRANAVAERLIGTLRRECIDHLIIINEAHLRSVLAEFMRYYNLERPIELWISTRPSSGSGQQPVRSAAAPPSAACTTFAGELHDWRQTCALPQVLRRMAENLERAAAA
jgi:Integrase core domain